MNSLIHSFGPPPKGQKIIATMDAAQSKEFVRVFNEITHIAKTWCCQIADSKISQCIGLNMFIQLDLEGIIGKGVNMVFTLNAKTLKDMRSLAVGELIVILSSSDRIYTFFGINTQYSISESDMIPTQAPPIFSGNPYIGVPVLISKFDLMSIRRYLGKKKAVHLLVYNNQLEQFCVWGGRPFTFNPNARFTIAGTEANLTLMTYSFMAIVGKHNVSLKIARNQHGFWLITESTMSLGVEPVTYELLS